MYSLVRRFLSRFMAKGFTPIRLVLIVLILSLTSAFAMNAVVEDQMLLLEAIQWFLGDIPKTP